MIPITEDQKKAVYQSNLRSYQVPRLFVYGAVRDLTMGGSGNSKENNPGSPDKPRP